MICGTGLLVGYIMKKIFLKPDDLYGDIIMLQTSLGNNNNFGRIF